jgi:hypothetical protein
MPESVSGPELRDQLSGWMAQGLIDAGHAARIAAAEAARPAAPAAGPAPAGVSGAADPAAAGVSGAAGPAAAGVSGPVGAAGPAGSAPGAASRRLPLVVEALGYLGAVFAVGAGFIAVRQIWPAIPASAALALVGVAATALLLAGIMLRTADHPAFGRLRSVVWLTSTVSLAAAVGLLTGPQFWDLGPVGRPLVTEAVVTAYAVMLWWRSRATLQHLAAFAGTAALLGTGIAQAWPSVILPWGYGFGLWVLSLLWGMGVHRGYLVPRTAGYAAAGIGLLVGAQLTMDLPAGQALAVMTVAGLLAAGVALRQVLLLGLGAFGAIAILPQVAIRYLPGGAGAAAAVFAVGLVMLGAALWLARARTTT